MISFSVQFSVLPKIAPFPTNDPFYTGDFFQQTCSIIHGDVPVEIYWLFDNEPIFMTENIRVENTRRTSTLTIESVGGENAGNYTCVATNNAGRTVASIELVVRGLYKFLNTQG